MPLTEEDKNYIETLLQNQLKSLETKFEKQWTTIRNYINTESEIQEQETVDIVFKDLLNKYPISIYTINKFELRKVLNIDGTLLTDLDGCIVIQKNEQNTPIPKQELNVLVNSRQKQRANNNSATKSKQYTGGSLEKYLIVIECKHSLKKSDVDKKIRQMMRFEEVIDYIQQKSSHYRSSNPFTKFVSEHKAELDILPSKIHQLYFATQYMTKDTQDYVKRLYQGDMTQEEYETISLNFVFKQKDIRSFIVRMMTTVLNENYNDNLQKNFGYIRGIFERANSVLVKKRNELLKEEQLLKKQKNVNSKDRLNEIENQILSIERDIASVNNYMSFIEPYSIMSMDWVKGRLALIIGNNHEFMDEKVEPMLANNSMYFLPRS